jgi:hypothetical protein
MNLMSSLGMKQHKPYKKYYIVLVVVMYIWKLEKRDHWPNWSFYSANWQSSRAMRSSCSSTIFANTRSSLPTVKG